MLHNFLIQGVADKVVPRDAVELWGDLEDWRHAVGTGPWILKDYVSGSSFTFTKNPKYWGYDELRPGYHLPYADGVTLLIIPDLDTQLAALHVGKIVQISGLNWEQSVSLAQTNPGLKQKSAAGSGLTVPLRYGKPPFDDFKVRRALQMAINLEELSRIHYGGLVEPIPYPLLAVKGLFTPFDELSEDVREGYVYNPEEAKQLLAEAGYPDGFKTVMELSVTQDMSLAQIIKAYWAEIGVDLEIKTTEYGAYIGTIMDGNLEATTLWSGQWVAQPIEVLGWYTAGKRWNAARIDDPYFNDLVNRASVSMDREEWRRLCKEAADYQFAQQWVVTLLPVHSFTVWQSWLGGYSGEKSISAYSSGWIAARVWINQMMRKAMGH